MAVVFWMKLCIMHVDRGKTIAQNIGNKGEAMAAEWLWLKGFQIIERNRKVGRFEIDLVCKDKQDWVFVEVKTRHEGGMNAPEIAVDYRKRHKIQQAAQRYLRESGDKSIPRIDLIAVSMLPYGAQMMYFQGK